MLSRPEVERMAANTVYKWLGRAGRPASEAVTRAGAAVLEIAIADLLLQVAGGGPVAWREAADRLHRNITDNPHPGIIAMSGIIEDARKLLVALGVIGETHGG